MIQIPCNAALTQLLCKNKQPSMTTLLHNSQIRMIYFMYWCTIFVLLMLVYEFLKPAIANLLIALYRYFVQGQSLRNILSNP